VGRGATEPRALGKKIWVSLGPQYMLPNDDLHVLEPAGHGGVVFRKIECLRFAVWECPAAHGYTVRLMRPTFLRSCERKLVERNSLRKKCEARPHAIILVACNEDMVVVVVVGNR
jgi:hypothetical protein